MESDIGRAVKLGIQRMKIKSIGSDPRKHTNDKIKSKLLADDSAPPMMMAPAPPVALGLGDLLVYAFVGLIVAVFVFQLVDTAQAARHKLHAKKHD